jgi:hypothetical protein
MPLDFLSALLAVHRVLSRPWRGWGDSSPTAPRLPRLKPAGARPLFVGSSRRAEAARRVTFKDAAEAYIKAHKAGWRNAKHGNQWRNTLATYAYPAIGALPVQKIDTGLVVRVLKPIWTTKTETASRVRQRIEAVLDSATARGHGAIWTVSCRLAPRCSGQSTMLALPYAELSAFMAELRQHPGLASAPGDKASHPDRDQDDGVHRSPLVGNRFR